jgi:hypothetical protein
LFASIIATAALFALEMSVQVALARAMHNQTENTALKDMAAQFVMKVVRLGVINVSCYLLVFLCCSSSLHV